MMPPGHKTLELPNTAPLAYIRMWHVAAWHGLATLGRLGPSEGTMTILGGCLSLKDAPALGGPKILKG